MPNARHANRAGCRRPIVSLQNPSRYPVGKCCAQAPTLRSAPLATRRRSLTPFDRLLWRKKSIPAACVSVGRLRVEGGERHSPSQWLHDRSSGVARWTKRRLACVPIVRLHPVPSQPVTGRRNNGEAQYHLRGCQRYLGSCTLCPPRTNKNCAFLPNQKK